MTDTELRETALDLFGLARDVEIIVTPLEGGANNRVFRVAAAGRGAVLKVYFQHPDDRRDRLTTEYQFVEFAWSSGVRAVPRPFAADWRRRAALYEDVAGTRLTADLLTDEHLAQAAAFLEALNERRESPAALALPPASEAFFSIGEHLEGVGKRVTRLLDAQGSDAVDRDAAAFINGELSAAWARVEAAARERARRLGLSLAELLPRADRCLSPSDFGFHNAILEPNGNLRFLDFEYAGWDDPAKVVCDFFSQVAVPVGQRYLEGFASRVAGCVTNPSRAQDRIKVLLPVYRLKWCCIMLNDFLPAGDARRRFVASPEAGLARKKRQLAQAKQALQELVAA